MEEVRPTLGVKNGLMLSLTAEGLEERRRGRRGEKRGKRWEGERRKWRGGRRRRGWVKNLFPGFSTVEVVVAVVKRSCLRLSLSS